MTEEEAFRVLEQVLGNSRLNKVQEIVFRQVWLGQSYMQISNSTGYDYGYIKDIGAELWQCLSKALDTKVTKLNLKVVLSQYVQAPLSLDSQALTSGRQDWGDASDVSVFYGRTAELLSIKSWVTHKNCRLVTILGMGGIGKTAFSIKVAEQLQPGFEHLIWRSLRDTPSLNDLLTTLIKFVSNQQETHLPETTGAKITQLIECLRKSRCLIILDNFDALLSSGSRTSAYQPGYENYGELLQRLGEISHQSCVLLTSREKPNEVAALEGKTLPIRSLQLTGLSTEESQNLFADKGLMGLSTDRQKLVDIYRGNPLALKIAATSIIDLFNGDITKFFQQETTVFNGIYALLAPQIKRLSALEEQIMFWLAINREPTQIAQLEADIIPTVSRVKLLEALELLIRRSLIDLTKFGYTQQPVVMEYMSNQLIEKVYAELTKTHDIQCLIQFALMKAQSQEYIQQIQTRIFLAPIAERLKANFRSGHAVEKMLQQVLLTLQNKFAAVVGYGGGNLINLLNFLDIDMTGYDFSKLTIWQADLRGVSLHQVNFAGADLDKSVFSETLGGILSVAVSANSELMAAGDTNGEIRVWRVSDSKQLLSLKRCASWVWSVAFSPAGQTVACCDDKTVKLWNIDTQKCEAVLEGHASWIYQVAYSPSGTRLASASTDSTIKIWDLQTQQCLHTLTGHIGFVFSVAFSPNGQYLVSGSFDQTIKLWDVSTGQCLNTFEGHTAWVWSVAFSPDGLTFASGSHDNTIKLWDIETGKCLKTLKGHTAWVWSVAFSPRGTQLASGSDDQTVRVWDCKTGQCIDTLQEHTSRIWSVAFSPHGEFLVSGAEDQSIRLWDMQDAIPQSLTTPSIHSGIWGRCRKKLLGATNLVWAIAFTPDGKNIFSGSEDQKIRLWNLETGDCVQTLEGHSRRIWSVACSPLTDSSNPLANLLVSSSDDHTIKIWQVTTGKCLQTLRGHLNWVNSVALSPDGKLLASGGGDNTVRLWDTDTGNCLQILEDHSRWIWLVTFSADGQLLASASGDGTFKLWDVQTRQCLATLPVEGGFVSAVAFSPTQTLVAATCGDNAVRVWDYANLIHAKTSKSVSNSGAELLQLIHTLRGHSNRVWCVAFSPQGHLLASGSEDCQVQLWDVETGECCKTFQGHQGRVQSVAFSPTDPILASGSYDETIQIWDLDSGDRLKSLQPQKLYGSMNLTKVSGLTKAQLMTLEKLGADVG